LIPVIVRIAKAADAHAIAMLHAESWRSAYRGILSDAFLDGPIFAERRALWEARLSGEPPIPSQHVALAERDGEATAFVCVQLDADPTWGALLDNLHVSPSAKGLGLGRRLMAEAATWVLRQRPDSRLHLWVYEQNLPARRFYEHLGGVANEQGLHEAPDGSRAKAVRYGWTDLERLT
jgi:GNAT superfamily N-acetyltransferase